MSSAGDIITLAKTMNAMDNEEIGSSSQAQTDSYIIFINRALKELAHLAYRTRDSDSLIITADGDQVFKKNAVIITDMYSPQRIVNDVTGKALVKRTSSEGSPGWWRESDGRALNVRGVTGAHTLTYVGYPYSVTDTGSELDFPEAGIMGLVFWVIGIAKESRNAFAESAEMYKRAQERLRILALSNEAARGYSTSGYVPAVADVDRIYRLGG